MTVLSQQALGDGYLLISMVDVVARKTTKDCKLIHRICSIHPGERSVTLKSRFLPVDKDSLFKKPPRECI